MESKKRPKTQARQIRKIFKMLDQEYGLAIDFSEISKLSMKLFADPVIRSNDTLFNKAGDFLYSLARHHSSGGEGKYSPELARELTCIAAQLGNFEAAYNSIEYQEYWSADDKLPQAPENWLETVFELGMRNWEIIHRDGPENLRSHINKLLGIISRNLSLGNIRQSIDWLGRLLVLAQETEDANARDIIAFRDKINKGDFIYVIDSIEPGSEKSIKEIVKQYKPLVTMPTPLVKIPDLQKLYSQLNTKFPWFSRVNTWVVRELAARAHGNGYFHLPPVLILGPPGIGKSAWASELAEISGCPFVTIGLAGQSDNKVLEATARGWSK